MASKESKNKKNKSKKSDSRLGAEVQGLGLMALGILALVSLASRVAQGPENLLGPYFGVLFSSFLSNLAGPLPAFALPFILLAAGWKRFRGEKSSASMRKTVFFSLLFLELCAFLSINMVPRVPAPGMLLGGGGWIGTGFALWVYIPLFGHSAAGPYLVTFLVMVLTVVWGARLKINHFLDLFEAIKGFFGDMRREVSDRWEDEEKGGKGKGKKPPRMNADDQLIRSEVAVRQDDAIKSLEEKQQQFLEEKSRIAPQIGTPSPEKTETKDETPPPTVAAESAAEKRARMKAELEARKKEAETEAENIGVSEPSTKSIPVIAGMDKHEKVEIQYEEYRFPPLELLKEPPPLSETVSKDQLLENSRILEEKLNDFGVQGKVNQVNPGPIITRYEIELAPGIKVNKVSNLDNDLAMALKATRVRILAPIPGKAAVGIEVPNPKPATIYLREILGSDKFPGPKNSLTLALGKTIIHEPYVTDLTKMPHLLVAGQTGSGKSVCINTIISSILYSKTPAECRLLMIDPKVVELALYNNIPHLLAPVVTDVRDAVKCLKWGVLEMERRYQLLAKAAVRNIAGFNEKVENGALTMDTITEEEKQRLPYIVVIIDELADLMMTAANEVETHIVRIAQLARAVGIHLIVATQRPSANVITGLIKANMPSRIAFQVASKLDSRVIIDQNGADKLLGRGDMLFVPPGVAEPMRLHGAFVTDSETESIVEAVRHQKVKADRLENWGIADEITLDADSDDEGGGTTDASLFIEAAHLVVRHQLGSTSLIQRRLKVGYARAGRLMDELEAAGIVGPNNGSKARDVRVQTESDLAEILDRHKQAGN